MSKRKKLHEAAVLLGSKGGDKGGPAGGIARMAALSPEERKALARKAAATRWAKVRKDAGK